jgi:hypothetical protein
VLHEQMGYRTIANCVPSKSERRGIRIKKTKSESKIVSGTKKISHGKIRQLGTELMSGVETLTGLLRSTVEER